ncbi:hypothetical protein ILUMI_19779 [Ignelater luminosus]|uniref:TTF-type domain-containing protein n=1 Tax=Ignelater luminosus TaxID=2038154 RepID=A0A8K0G563_IGNLU|nr:hypothetical protein ILUMI_19779 [Ignelater luminosus]
MERKRKKLTGSQYKKEEQGKRLSYVMKEFLVQKSYLDEPSTSTSTATALDLANKNSVPPQSLPEKVVEESKKVTPSEVHQEPGSSSSGSQQILNKIPSDPALWNAFRMSSEARHILVERDPHQIKEFEFPINKERRRFSPSHYLKVLSNGEVVERSWLIYSVTNDAVFCFCCILFDNSSASSDWPKKGYSDWGNLITALTLHEKSVNHKTAFRAWKELDIRLKQKKAIDAEYQRIMDMEIQYWRGALGSAKKYVSQLTLKPLSATRWSSRVETLKPLRFQLCEIYDALFQIIEDVNRDAETKVKARRLARSIKNYKFVCGVILWHDIIFEINSLSKLLQSITINLSDCVRMLSETIQKVKSYRQSGYDQMKIAANEIAGNLECRTEFPTETEVRARRKKRQFDYEEAVDEPLAEGE